MPIARSVIGWNTAQPAPLAYTTSFSLTENPMIEDGGWRLGSREGSNWQDVRTSSGDAFGVAVSGGYDDCLGCRAGNPADHYAEGVISKAGAYSPGVSHEVELLVRFAITTGVARGYEVTWDIASTALQVIKWNGTLGDFTPLSTSGAGPGRVAADGDVLRVEMVGANGTIKLNGTSIYTFTDSTWATGDPGIGCFARAGATMANYCWHSWAGGAL